MVAGVDVTPAMLKAVDAAVEKAYKGEMQNFLDGNLHRRKSTQAAAADVWLPAETLIYL